LDDSVRVAVEGSASGLPRPADVRVVFVAPKIGESIVPPSQQERIEAQEAVERIAQRLARVDAESGTLSQVTIALPEPFENRPPRPAPAAAWLKLGEWLPKARGLRVDERAKILDELRRAQETLARIERRDAEARAARDTKEDTVRKRLL